MSATATALLRPPTHEGPILDPIQTIHGWSGVLSPSKWLDFFLEKVTGQGIPFLDAVAADMVGNWEQVQLSADALRKLASYDREVAATLRRAATDLAGGDADWHGEAAEAAGEWFGGLAAAVDRHADQIDVVASEVDELVMGAYQIAEAIKGPVMQVVDSVMIAVGIAVASAGMPLSWILSLAVVGLAIRRARNAWAHVITGTTQLVDAYVAATAAVGSTIVMIDELETITMPSRPEGPRDDGDSW